MGEGKGGRTGPGKVALRYARYNQLEVTREFEQVIERNT